MGLFDNVRVEEGVALPHLPDSIDATEIGWQSKSFERGMRTYTVTENGRLLRKEQSYRDKTADEKQSEAAQWGFDSWDEYTTAYDEHDPDEEGLIPDAVEWDEDSTDNEHPPSLVPRETLLDEEWWADQDYHGSFDFYSSIKRDPVEYEEMQDLDGNVMTDENGEPVTRPSEYALDVFVCYEARFTEGDLDEIILTERHDDRDDVIRELTEWEEI